MTPDEADCRPRGPLAEVKVLDLSRVLAGPWATQVLADLGADVIKVERPGAGDDTRAWGPPFLPARDGARGDAAYFTCANRNKRSITLDISTREGADIAQRLAARCDVLVENYKVDGLKKYGLDYVSLRPANPKLVYCSITGFGQNGPYAARAGYDYMIQAQGGLMSVTGQPDGAPGAEPMRVGVAVVDLFTGLYAANAVQAGLLHARATGEGQAIDIALFDVQAAVLANQAANYFATGVSPGRLGNAHPNLSPYQVFATADGALVLAVGNNGQFQRFCRAAGVEALGADPRFVTNADRVAHRAELTAALAPVLAARSTADWIVLLDAVGTPCGPINSVEQVFQEPQALARGLVVEQERDDLEVPVASVASPIRMSATPVAYRSPAPALGAHTAEVLAVELGLDAAEIAGLAADGVT